MFKYFALLSLTITSLLSSSFPVYAESVQGEAILCTQRGWYTEMAISTQKFDAAVCFSDTNSYYIGQSKHNKEKIILPLNSNSSQRDDGTLYQAINGLYTYQLFSKKVTGCAPYAWATLSVFKNGNKIYHQKVNKFISTGAACHGSTH